MTMLQRITATTILDYDEPRRLPSSSTASSRRPSVDDLLATASGFRATHGPIVDLQTVIASQHPRMALAAEFKRALPSRGPIAPNLLAGEQASLYHEAGACVISVLTEGRWFGGSLADLTEARLATTTKTTTTSDVTLLLPRKKKKENRPAILRKDFIITFP